MVRKPRKRYDDQFRADAILMLQSQGYPKNAYALQRVADHLGIPSRTLRRWHNGESNPPPDNVVKQEKRAMSAELQDMVYELIGVVRSNLDDVSTKDALVGIGIGIEKLQLLSGKPTQRIATMQEWLDELPADEYNSVIEEAERIIREGGGANSRTS